MDCPSFDGHIRESLGIRILAVIGSVIGHQSADLIPLRGYHDHIDGATCLQLLV